MNTKTKQKLINGCMAVAFVLSSTITPLVANAATLSDPSSVTRIGGVDRFETAVLMSQKGWAGTSDNVILSAGMDDNLVDALAAGPLATKLIAPILLTDGGQSLNSFAKVELQRLKPKKVYLTSGTDVIKPSVVEELKAMGVTPVQLGGRDRFETSVNIAKELTLQGVNISRVVITGGYASPADALSVSSIAATQGMPIILTAQGQLPALVKTYIDSIKANVTDSYIIGGPVVVSDAVKAELPGEVSRYAGLNRYDTNVQVLKNFAKEYKNDKVYFANGATLVDAVAGVPLAAANRSPVVLVNQPIENVTKEFVKLNMSTDDVVILGSEAAISSAGMSALTSVVTYATDGVTVGSADSTKPEVLTDNVRITGNNITLKNAKADYSVYVKGNNITLSNLTVKGTVFVDPGTTGTATLDGVTAANIVILSGGKNSIHISNSTAGVLTVDSDSDTRVEATGTTTIGNTVVRSYAILDANGGSMGEVVITSTPGQDPVVELRGTFTEPVVVEGQCTVKAAAGSSIATLQFEPQTTDTKVTLEGTFKSVEANMEGNLALGSSAVVTNLITNVDTNLNVASGATVTNFDDRGNDVEVEGPGPLPDSKPIAQDPDPDPNPNPNPNTTPTVQVAAITVTTGVLSENRSALNQTADFDDELNTLQIKGIEIDSNVTDPSLVIESISIRGQNWLSEDLIKTLPLGVLTIGELLGSDIDQGNNGISLGNLRLVLGTEDIVISGYLKKSGYYNSSGFTVTMNLGMPLVGVIPTQILTDWGSISRTGVNKATVNIDTTIGAISDVDVDDFANLVIAVASGSATVTGGTLNSGNVALLKIGISNLVDAGGNMDLTKLTGMADKVVTFGGYEITITVD